MVESLDSIVAEARVVVCVGPGGVGKTSTSAALGMHAALQGRRVIVLTIDPARRLANALGLPEIGNEERIIRPDVFVDAGLEMPTGTMSAMMLDIKSAWDEVIHRYHPNPEARERLLANRFYQALSTKLAGSQEYMAMEKLYELSTRARDPLSLIVLDTPPAASAVDFLEAPSRLIAALDNDGTRWLLEPYLARRRVTQKLFDAGSSFVIRTIGRFTGIETLQALAEMLSGFAGMFEGFRERARAVRALLNDEQTSFVIVSAPRPGPVAAARAFHERRRAENVQVGAMVLNRATNDPFSPDIRGASRPTVEAVVRDLGGSPELAARLIAEAEQAQTRARAEREIAETIERDLPDLRLAIIPELMRDVHDLRSLDTLRQHLFRAHSTERAPRSLNRG